MTLTARKEILFIDDDEDDYMLLRDIFAECGDVELRWCKDGEAALERLLSKDNPRSSHPAVVILDINMPKLNGAEVLRQIRSHPDLRHIPVAVLTNSLNQKEALEAYRLGANSFIRKPSGYKELQDFTKTFYKYWFDYSVPLSTD